ncbi:hypothetical protein HK097_004225 [Rhizophlyctis rosea]|uniref:Dolichol-phosphate mannosyltransferase subunit 3 n=1 Tax=Rhizophlyctis rosea TaxID=64517 RepID=A0AAD5S1N2_9FUNG|nr:hypothetical protein HK097_004225 [Rhizophlyctis rosea]
MTKATQALTTFALFFALWTPLFFHSSILPFLPISESLDRVIAAIPLWLIVSFGSYSLASIGYALFTFRDCPEAHQSLLAEINAAKTDLRARGVSVD